MDMVRMEYHDNVAVIRLSRDVTNALGPQLVADLAETLQEVRHAPDAHALVLSSANDKFFSIGLDLPQLYGMSREEFTSFYQAYSRMCMDLYTLPKPTIAAITGHALAGGCIVTLCCDYRLIAEGRKLMGLNEVKLGIPVPYVADCILRHLVGVRNAREIMDVGEFYQPDVLYQLGMVDQVLPLEQVVPKAIEKAGLLGALPQGAFTGIKRNRIEPVEAEIAARLEEKAQVLVDLWFADEARQRLKQAMEKF